MPRTLTRETTLDKHALGSQRLELQRRGFLSGILMLGASCVETAAGESKARPDAALTLLRRVMVERGIPGLQYAIVRNGAIAAHGALGFANIEHRVRVTRDTLFQINSITKAFTGVAAMQLVDAGLLDVDARLSRYLSNLPAGWAAVTVRNCLTHTSGLPQIMDQNGVLIAPTFEAAWDAVKRANLESAPGAQFSYNQTNYFLIGRIIERLSGKPFTRFIDERQFKTAGMPLTARAGFVDANDIVVGAARVYSFGRRIGEEVHRTNVLGNNPFFEEVPPPLRTAAGMFSTAVEIARWVIALQSHRLLRPESLRTLWTPGRLSDGSEQGFGDVLNGYALGWPVMRRARHRAVGGIGGGRAAFFVYPEDDAAAVVLTNLRGASPESFVDSLVQLD